MPITVSQDDLVTATPVGAGDATTPLTISQDDLNTAQPVPQVPTSFDPGTPLAALYQTAKDNFRATGVEPTDAEILYAIAPAAKAYGIDIGAQAPPERPGVARRLLQGAYHRAFIDPLASAVSKAGDFVAPGGVNYGELFDERGGQSSLGERGGQWVQSNTAVPSNPAARTTGEKLTDIGSGLAGFIAQLAIAKRFVPANLAGTAKGEALAWEIVNQANGGTPGIGAAQGMMFHGIGSLPAASATQKVLKVGAESAANAGITSASGGDTTDIVAAAALPLALHGIAAVREAARTGSRAAETAVNANGNSQSPQDAATATEVAPPTSESETVAPVDPALNGEVVSSPAPLVVSESDLKTAAPIDVAAPVDASPIETPAPAPLQVSSEELATALPEAEASVQDANQQDQKDPGDQVVLDPVHAVGEESPGVAPQDDLTSLPEQTAATDTTPATPSTVTAPEADVKNPESFGIGPSTPSINDPNFSEISPTGVKNATVDQERVKRGLAPAMEAGKRSFGDVWDSAMQEIDRHPSAQNDLIHELKAKPRALTDREDALLLHRQIELQNEFDGEAKALQQAQEANDPAGVEEHRIKVAALSDKLLETYNVLKTSGTETGRGLNARKLMANDDFTLAAMETAKRAANEGKPLTPEQSDEVKSLHEKIAKLQKDLEDYQTKKNTAESDHEAQLATKRARRNVAIEKAQDKKAGVVRDVEKQHQAIIGGLKKNLAEGGPLSDSTNFIQRLAESFVRKGIVERDPLVDAVHGVLKDIRPDITRRQTMDAISGYGDFKPLNPDAVKAKLRDLKGQMQQVGKIQDMEGGKAPLKTGVERKIPSDEERRLIKQVNETKRRLGIQTTDSATQLKSALDGIKTRLKNQIADLEYQISTGKKIVKNKTAGPSDAETVTLRTRQQELRKQFDDVFGKPELTDAQRLKIAMQATEKSIAEYERRIKEGDLYAKTKQGTSITSPELEAARARRDALGEDLKNLKNLDTATVEGAKEKRLADSIDALNKKITAGDASTRMGTPTVDSKTVADLKAQREALNQQLQEMRKIAKPKKSADEIALQAFKARTAHGIADLADKIASADFSKTPRREIKLDAEANRMKAEHERLKQIFREDLTRDRMKKRTTLEKVQDTFLKWRRASLLSSPVTIAKLASAAFERLAITPVEEAVGAGIGKFIQGVASRAPSEGGLSIKAEAKAITEGFTAGMKDAHDLLKTGKSNLDVLYGKHSAMPKEAIDFVGNIHGALKSPTKRAAFARSMQKRTEFAIRNGLDVTDPLVQSRIALDAYKDANRSIFLQDNRVVDAYKRGIEALERPSKVTGRPTVGGKAAGTVGRALLPIVKVPTNIVAETMQYATGAVTGSARLAIAYAKGIENLKPEEADLIMRDLKKGSLGAAALAVGFMNPGSIGGYYQPGQNRNKGDVKFGAVRVSGYDLPSYLIHNPLLEALQIGATARRVADSRLKKKDKETQGIGAGALAAAMGLTEEVPFVRETLEVGKAFDPQKQGTVVGKLAESMVVPQASDWAARQMDKNSSGEVIARKPKGIVQNIETGIPGLRKTIPEAAADHAYLKTRPYEEVQRVYDQASDAARAAMLPILQKKLFENKTLPAAEKTKLMVQLRAERARLAKKAAA